MQRSEDLKEFTAALAVVQGALEGAKKDSENPHFRSKYADLASVWAACRKPLSANGFALVQTPRLVPPSQDGMPWIVDVETMMLHSSGQWISDVISVPMMKADAHGVGAAITYCRRFALAAFVGISPEDDDGNAAVGRPIEPKSEPVKPEGFDDWFTDIGVVGTEQGTAALKAAFTKSDPDYRAYLTGPLAAKWAALKAAAAKVTA